MANKDEPDDLQIPLLTDIVEGGEEEEMDDGEITLPPDEPPLISKMEIAFIVQTTLAKHLVDASKQITDLIHAKIKERQREDEK